LKETNPQSCVKEYLGILKAASQNGEMRVIAVLKNLLKEEQVSLQLVLDALALPEKIVPIASVEVSIVDLNAYDLALLQETN
jgi:hypothetical protein